MTLALILLPFCVLLFWTTGILAPLLGVVGFLTYKTWRKYAR